jgi:hypothetical protein
MSVFTVPMMMRDVMTSASRNTSTSGGGTLSVLGFAVLLSVDALASIRTSLGGSMDVGVHHASGGRSLTILLTSR